MTLKHRLKKEGYSTQLVENIELLCKKGKMVIPKSLQHHAVAWFHHYLQHPGTKCLKETLSFDVLERSTNDSPITCQEVSQLPGEQMQTTQIWQTANKTCNHQSLGGIMCGSHRTIHPQGQGQDTY